MDLDWGNPSELRRVREEIVHMTGLPGWRRFVEKAQECIARSRMVTENPHSTNEAWRAESGKIYAVQALLDWPVDLLSDIQEHLDSLGSD